MPYVVTSLCLDCKYTDCASVCPTQAFHAGPDRLFIDPDVCIDCDACKAECPVDAIFADSDLPAQYGADKGLNASECGKYPVIVDKVRAMKGSRCVNSAAAEN